MPRFLHASLAPLMKLRSYVEFSSCRQMKPTFMSLPPSSFFSPPLLPQPVRAVITIIAITSSRIKLFFFILFPPQLRWLGKKFIIRCYSRRDELFEWRYPIWQNSTCSSSMDSMHASGSTRIPSSLRASPPPWNLFSIATAAPTTSAPA